MDRALPLKLKVLTPTFIGGGGRLLPMEIYAEGNTVKVFKFENLIGQISRLFPPKAIKNLMLQISGKVGQRQKQVSLNEILKEINLSVERLKPDYTLQVEGHFHPSEVEEFIKTLEGVYIPGSELKGALRTAIFYHILINYKSVWERFIKELKWFLNNFDGKKIKDFAQHWENKIFAGKPLSEPFRGRESPKGTEDILKFLQVEDSETKEPSKVLVLKHLTLRNTKKDIRAWVESLKVNSTFEFKIGWNSRGVEKFVGTRLKNLDRELREFWLQLTEEKLLNYLDRFTRDLITFEEEKRKYNRATTSQIGNSLPNELIAKLEKLKREFLKKETTQSGSGYQILQNLKKESGYLLRLGKYTGRYSHSILLAVYKKDREFYEKVLRYKFSSKTYWEDEEGNPIGFCKLEN